ncbi:butyrophilin subfamily 2 member A2-like [Scomber scombrus]|uniref:Butyrophilin subfamily 2 member A2-like n=1 Tax=Scomber scombrus TaxID=13677 RepID=A0AAV1Q5F2_SCOSC
MNQVKLKDATTLGSEREEKLNHYYLATHYQSAVDKPEQYQVRSQSMIYRLYLCSLNNRHIWQQNCIMLHQTNRPSLQSPLKIFGVLVLHVLLTHSCRGQSQLIGPSQPIVATVRHDVILPCQLQPAEDVSALTVEWTRSDLDSIYVHVCRAGQELMNTIHPSYRGRTSLFIDELKQGNISLKLSKVKLSDGGKYKCLIPKLNKESFVELVVGKCSGLPVISLAGIDRVRGGVVLQCESKGWYPQPEVIWLDSEGNLLSAGPTETIRGPDDLYTVSSRVTVENKHSNSFTCRVQQNNINQTRETHIVVPDDFFMAPSSCAACITTSVLFSVMFILAVAIFIWKWRYYKTEIKMDKKKENEEQLQTESKNIDDLELKLNKELQQKEEEKKNMEQLIDALVEQKKELVSQKEQITVQMEKTEELYKENNTKVNAVDEEISGKEGDKTENKALGYLKLKEIIKEANWNLDERRQEQQLLILNTDKLMERGDVEFKRMTDKKKQVENNVKEINKQLEKIYRQREEIQKKLESEEKGRGDTLTLPTEIKMHKKKENEEQLQTESKNIEDLELKLNKELQQKEEEKKNVEQLIDALVEQKKELVSQKEQITVQMEKTEELYKENNTKVNAVDEEISGKEGDKTENKATGYLKLKEIISETNWNLDERREEQQVLIFNTDKIMGRTDVELKRMTDKKKQVENNMKEINKQLEKIYRQREEIQKKLESEEKGLVFG